MALASLAHSALSMAPSDRSNRFFVCLWAAPGKGQAAQAFDPYAEESMRDVSGGWWGRVFQTVDHELPAGGFTVYLTWDLDELPSYGDDVVAISIGDEWGLTPRWAPRVRAAFKIHGARPWLERNPLREPSHLAMLTLLRYGRSRALRAGRRGRSERPAEVITLPVGWSNLTDLPLKPFDERETAAFFAGSIENQDYGRLAPARYVGTPKQVARSEMMKAVESFGASHPETRLRLRVTSDYWASMNDDASTYAEALMDARICLAPRGTTVETYRVFEGLRYGCVVICDPLPRTWYYEGAPVIELPRWKDLPALLERLLADEEALQQRHEAGLRFYEDRLSERAVGRFVAQRTLAPSLALSAGT